MNILHIDSSILGEHSASRRLSAAIVARLRDAHPNAAVVYRDLAARAVPAVSGALANLAALPIEQQTPELRRSAGERQAALDEVLAADVVVIGAPMYNFGIPSSLKDWVDALAVPGVTFAYGPEGPKGLLGAKRVIVASARGGLYGADSPMAALDHQETHLRTFLSTFLGVSRYEVVRAEGLKLGPEASERAMASALDQAAELATA